MSSRERKTEARDAATNPVKGAVKKSDRPVPAHPNTRLDPVTGEQREPSPVEGRKGNLPATNPHERVDFEWPELSSGIEFVWPDHIVRGEE